MKYHILSFWVFFIFFSVSAASPVLYSVPAEIANSVNTDAPEFQQRLQWLRSKRAELLATPPYNIVENKVLVAESGDPHDYISVGPYFWPDPTRSGGLPYIEKDGEFNPLRAQYDNGKLWKMADSVINCALLYHFDQDKEAAVHAARQLDVFFLAPETRMNPNLNHGQSIPGKVKGRPAGMIDALQLIEVVDAIGMLLPSCALSAGQIAGLRQWFKAYADWMRTDAMARKDWPVTQNHGLSYHAQIAAYLAFAGDLQQARYHAAILRKRLIAAIDENGIMPAEVRRTNGWSYSTFALSIAMRGVGIAENLDVDFLSADSECGRKLRKAIDYLIQYVHDPGSWPYREIAGMAPNRLTPVLLQFYRYTEEEKYLKAYRGMPGLKINDSLIVLFYTPSHRRVK